MDTLTRLFGSTAKVKILKLFVFNPGRIFDVRQIAQHTKEGERDVRSELTALLRMGLIYKRKSRARGKGSGFTLDQDFAYLEPLETFLTKVNYISPKEMGKKLGKAGVIKLIIISGIFIDHPESRLDLLVVGDHLKKNVLLNAIRTIESEIGREIHFAYFETPDFRYRLGLYDKLLRDLLEYPHEKIVNKLGI